MTGQSARKTPRTLEAGDHVRARIGRREVDGTATGGVRTPPRSDLVGGEPGYSNAYSQRAACSGRNSGAR